MRRLRRFWIQADRAESGRTSLRRFSPDNPILGGLLAIAFLVAVVFALSFGRAPGYLDITADDVGEIAPRQIVATHDFTFAKHDDELLERAQAEARRRVRPVWDYEAWQREQTVDRVARAFRGMRQELRLAAQDRHVDLPNGESPSQNADDADTDDEPQSDTPHVASIDDLSPEERVEIASSPHVLEEFIRRLQRGVDRPVLEALASEGFSEESELALRRVLMHTLEQRIVADRQVLLAEADEGITLRTLSRGGEARERNVRDFDGFLDASEVGSFIERNLMAERSRLDSEELISALQSMARTLATVNTTFNERETRARQEAAVEAVTAGQRVRDFRRGQVILDAGRVIDEEVVDVVNHMRDELQGTGTTLWNVIGLALLVSLITLPLIAFSIRDLRHFNRKARDLTMLGSLLIVHLLVTRVTSFIAEAMVDQGSVIPLEALFVLAPFATGAMIVRILTTAESSLVYALVYALLSGIIYQFDLSYVTYAFVAGIAGSAAVGRSQSRTDVLRAGLIVGVVMAAIALTLGLYQGSLEVSEIGAVALLALLSGVLSALLVFALIPLVEHSFAYTTSFRLLELANLNHPALRELILQAPGSYHHSMMVGQLVEAGCEAVDADALLGRVGAYFHDIGKAKNPKYFAENQGRENIHDTLTPHMSALVIKAHVKDGVELAKQHHLPIELIDFIREHHGTSRINYFYEKARKDDPKVHEPDFRYPGPKPRTRETAICLLADQIEAAARSLPSPDKARLDQLVRDIIKHSFEDGQLDSCDLTLSDLELIGRAFSNRLLAIYHNRPVYPSDLRSAASSRQTASGGASAPISGAETESQAQAQNGRHTESDDDDAGHNHSEHPPRRDKPRG